MAIMEGVFGILSTSMAQTSGDKEGHSLTGEHPSSPWPLILPCACNSWPVGVAVS